MSVCAGPGCTDERCGHEIPKLAAVDKLVNTLSGVDFGKLMDAMTKAHDNVERGTRVNPDKDRSLRGKARRKARRS